MITFQTDLPTGILYSANNAVIRFTPSEASVFATITAFGISAKIYPSPTGQYYFNFKTYFEKLTNNGNYFDDLNPNFPTYVYGSTYFINLEATITVTLSSSETEFTNINRLVIAGAKNLGDTEIELDDFPLLPLFEKTDYKFYAKYWAGLPFDLPFVTLSNEFVLDNLTNATGIDISASNNVSRLLVSDGRTDVSLEDELPLVTGLNTLQFYDSKLFLDKVTDYCGGVYLKWFYKGGFCYWNFPNFYQATRSHREIGEINTDFENLNESFGTTTQIGRTAFDSINVNSDTLLEEEFNLLATILESPKVFLFTGIPFTQNNENDWIEVNIRSGSQIVRNFKNQPKNITFTIEKPQRYTVKI